MTFIDLTGPNATELMEQVRVRSALSPWFLNYTEEVNHGTDSPQNVQSTSLRLLYKLKVFRPLIAVFVSFDTDYRELSTDRFDWLFVVVSS